MLRPCFPPTSPGPGVPFPPQGPRGAGSPGSTLLWNAPPSGRPPRLASLSFAWRYHPLRLRSCLSRTRRRSENLELCGLAAPRQLSDGDDWTSQVPGEPWCAYALVSDPGGTDPVRPCDGPARPPLRKRRRLPAMRGFRGSIPRPRHSLSTLRPAGYPDRTPDSLPAVGHTLRDGIAYPQGSNERFP